MAYTRKYIYIGIVIGMVALGMFTPVAPAKAISVEELVAYIQKLTKQLDLLKAQLEAETKEQFSVDIRYGTRNNASVRRLQQFLIEEGYLGKGFATGNFFTLTRDALRRFQQANKIPITGLLDAKTRKVVNELLQGRAVGEADIKTLIVKTATTTPVVMATTTAVIPAKTRPTYALDPRPTYDLMTIERLAFDAVNAERQKNGVGALTWNEQAAAVARAHSADQAGDNAVITNPDVACLYPFIRHEGFIAGFKAGDRLERAGIQYRLAGENIIILPMTKELIYQAESAGPVCRQASETEGLPGETVEAARIRIKAELDERIGYMTGQHILNWVNKEWKGSQDIASESAVDWMNSPGHRRNILTAEFAEGGMGAAIVNDYVILTQVFLKKP